MDTASRPRALIADDEPFLAADLASRLAQQWPELDIVAVVHHGPAALDVLGRLTPDIAFLDIRMPGLSGLEVAARARVPHLVFVTAYDQYAVAAFEHAAADYLLKPVSDTRLQKTVDRLKAHWHEAAPPAPWLDSVRQLLEPRDAPLRWIHANVGNEVHLVDVGEVLFFRSDDKYTVVQTRDREYLIRTALKELLPQLDPEFFWQIHRNTLVNTRAIASARRELSGRYILALRHHPATLTVSRAYAHLFRSM